MIQQNTLTSRHVGNVVIITGSGRGLGAAMALRLAAEGASVCVNDLNAENAQSICKEIESIGAQAMFDTHDVSTMTGARSLVSAVRLKFGRINALVNNAGITRDAMLHKMTEEHFDEVIRVNLKGVFNCVQAVGAVMAEQKAGHIVNISSISAFGNVGQINYSASKAGVIGLTRTAALELSRFGITVNAIAPGFFNTVLTQQIPDDVKARFVARIPLKRMGDPAEMAGLVAFLTSKEAAYITGQTFVMDGGLSVGLSAF